MPIRLCLALALVLTAPAAARGMEVGSLVVFGDSNVDIGRAYAEAAGDRHDGRLPGPETVGRRRSDGPLFHERVAGRLGVPLLSYGLSGAVSGRGARAQDPAAPDVARGGLAFQIDAYAARLDGARAPGDALFVIFSGSNDIGRARLGDPASVEAAVARAIAGIGAAAARLVAMGAGQVLVATRTTRPALSDAPRPSAEPDPARRNDAAGRLLNARLRAAAAGWAKVRIFDVYALTRDLIDGAPGNGFAPYSGAPDHWCVQRTDCAGLINWDGAHKTAALHAAWAEAMIAAFDLTPPMQAAAE